VPAAAVTAGLPRQLCCRLSAAACPWLQC
jgi:hypothetical protein